MQIRGNKYQIRKVMLRDIPSFLVIGRGTSEGYARGNFEAVACPSDVQEWQYWDNEWKNGGDNIRLSCANSIGKICPYFEQNVTCACHPSFYTPVLNSRSVLFFSQELFSLQSAVIQLRFMDKETLYRDKV